MSSMFDAITSLLRLSISISINWKSVLAQVVSLIAVLAAWSFASSLEEWSEGIPLMECRAWSRFVWLAFELAVSALRASLLPLALCPIGWCNRPFKSILLRVEAWCDALRPSVMAGLCPRDFWNKTRYSMHDSSIHLNSHKGGCMQDFQVVNIDTLCACFHALTRTVQTLENRIYLLEQQLAQARVMDHVITGEKLLARYKVSRMEQEKRAQTAIAKRASASAVCRSQAIRKLLACVLLLWWRRCQLSSRLAWTTKELYSAQDSLATLTCRHARQIDECKRHSAEVKALHSALQDVRSKHTEWIAVCRQILAIRFQEVDAYLLTRTWYRQYFYRLVLLWAALWRFAMRFRREAIMERAQADAARRDEAMLFLRFRTRYRTSTRQLLTCVLVLWRLSRYLGLQLARNHIGMLVHLVSGEPLVHEDPSLSMERLLAIRVARMHSANSVVTAQRDRFCKALCQAEQNVRDLEEDQRNTAVALALLYMSTIGGNTMRVVRQEDVSPVSRAALAPAPSGGNPHDTLEMEKASRGELTEKEKALIEKRLKEVLKLFTETETEEVIFSPFAPDDEDEDGNDTSRSPRRPLTLLSNTLQDNEFRSPLLGPGSPLPSPGSPDVPLAELVKERLQRYQLRNSLLPAMPRGAQLNAEKLLSILSPHGISLTPSSSMDTLRDITNHSDAVLSDSPGTHYANLSRSAFSVPPFVPSFPVSGDEAHLRGSETYPDFPVCEEEEDAEEFEDFAEILEDLPEEAVPFAPSAAYYCDHTKQFASDDDSDEDHSSVKAKTSFAPPSAAPATQLVSQSRPSPIGVIRRM
ncbi:uncharacterized protein LAESUDRAFT_764471 [Laetiporus sulphureus 93-53]|uniref:Uncharacterized protein n=1 Tax=Laetiporus sulphureus 93-53 TaxID=1314785 RepID=A0A165B9H3_9APHY|nr:uncharacterized protein LAESUDRAFT_764471 [Laetiporus sulphureus 93-53]KZT00554.1 hypothetical protein LAESUDRAFT_764471 [Laetiporus sulphureus 93-53]